MELIKKTILQAVTTGTTTGCTGSCRIIIPNSGATYCFKIGLTQEAIDIGFFDAYVEYGGYGYGGNDVNLSGENIIQVSVEPIGINNLL